MEYAIQKLPTMRLSTYLMLLCLSSSLLLAQDGELQQGLVGEFRSEDSKSYQRVNEDVAFHWNEQEAQSFSGVTWSGQVLIRSLTPYRFYAQASGELSVKIDGQLVLQAKSMEPQWSPGSAQKIAPGFRDIEVEYVPAGGESELRLFWSNEEFTIEPIPSHLLFHETESDGLQEIELGEKLFDAYRCANCHREKNEQRERFPGPALWGVTTGTNRQWIVEKLLGRHAHRMPDFGFTEQQALDISAYLHQLQAPFDLMSAPDAKREKNAPTGESLFYSLGCLACHQLGNVGATGPYAGPSLTSIGRKRSADWLATWLAVPERLNPQHRMPTFQLRRSERGLLVKFLSSLGQQSKAGNPGPQNGDSDRGRALVKEFHCASCHKLPAIEPTAEPPPSLVSRQLNWEESCVGTKVDQSNQRPRYEGINAKAIRSFVESRPGHLSPSPSSFSLGQKVIERRQCLACHSRGSAPGIRSIVNEIAEAHPDLKGQTQLIIAPSLNAVGDKLRDNVLDKALSGQQDRIRANWLRVRMPQFRHTPEELTALKQYLIRHDRIPAPAAANVVDVDLDADELLLTGRKLIGAGGLSCIACHQVGDYVPKNTAIGTRGSDLLAIGSRLRPEFYQRWTRAPLRVVPGMEMPSYNKPVVGILDDDIQRQLGALWKALNNDRFEAPTNPTQVEQLWQVAAGERPRIVRDVFTIPGEQPVARAFAVGFGNQHGILFDLDQAALRQWRLGDFARQRTEGKSWYWDMAGASIADGFDTRSDIVIIKQSDSSIHPLKMRDADRLARLVDYATDRSGVAFRYHISTLLNGQAITVPVHERFSEINSSGEHGWLRSVDAHELPTGYKWGVVIDNGLNFQLAGVIQPDETTTRVIQDGESIVAMPNSDSGGESVAIRYLVRSRASRSLYPERKGLPVSPERVTTLPGYVGHRLPIESSLMPTSITRDQNGDLLVTSLKGHLVRVRDSNGDGIEDRQELIEEGLSAAFGVAVDGNDLLVVHKPELLRLVDVDADGTIDRREVVADGWGHTDNYHDWVTGPVSGQDGSWFIATGSDYAQPQRDLRYAKWRGSVVRSRSDGTVDQFANELRYPIGIAGNAQGQIFVSDQQGVQNTFNEINHIVQGAAYGVPGRRDNDGAKNPRRATIQVPHPWTRSVNGIFFLPESIPSPFAGHGIGCEYNSKFLIRFTTQEVNGELQGACYPFSRATWQNEAETFLGPICGYVGEDGAIYIGSIFDSGWLGGPNVGEVVKLTPKNDPGNGIRELRAVPNGFEVSFISPVDRERSLNPQHYSLSGYTRVWQGTYATEDSGRYSPDITKVELSKDRRTVRIEVDAIKEGFVYEINVGEIGDRGTELFPSFAAYTMNQIPK